jgi:hypothetical protein
MALCFFRERRCTSDCKAFDDATESCRLMTVIGRAAEGLHANVDLANIAKKMETNVEPVLAFSKRLLEKYEPLLDKAIAALEEQLDDD